MHTYASTSCAVPTARLAVRVLVAVLHLAGVSATAGTTRKVASTSTRGQLAHAAPLLDAAASANNAGTSTTAAATGGGAADSANVDDTMARQTTFGGWAMRDGLPAFVYSADQSCAGPRGRRSHHHAPRSNRHRRVSRPRVYSPGIIMHVHGAGYTQVQNLSPLCVWFVFTFVVVLLGDSSKKGWQFREMY